MTEELEKRTEGKGDGKLERTSREEIMQILDKSLRNLGLSDPGHVLRPKKEHYGPKLSPEDIGKILKRARQNMEKGQYPSTERLDYAF